MNWTKFLTYGESQQDSFETLCTQLFERFLRRTYSNDLVKYRVINGAGGDGGIEAYGELVSGEIIAIQAKWFREVLKHSEIGQIRKSVKTAKELRSQIKEYIICIPHNVSSLKYGRGKKGLGKKQIENFEERAIDDFTIEITTRYPDLKITWWFEKDIELELQQKENEGVYKFWFEKEIISLKYLIRHFSLQKKGWLHQRYIPELHGQGIIHKEYQKLCFSTLYRNELHRETNKTIADLKRTLNQIERFIPTNTPEADLNRELILIKENLTEFLGELQKIAIAVETGNHFYKPKTIAEVDLWQTKLKLEKRSANNIQKNILPKLVRSLDNIHSYHLPQYIEYVVLCFNQKIRLILGEPGTGKTHGLANCVEFHLAQNSPSIIIQAKGSPFNDWTEILSKSLEVNNWNKDEILSALETLAIRNDVRNALALKAGEEVKQEFTKALVCIDGLEEEIKNDKEWYARIRECEQLAIEYPRIRFIFSARKYFYDSNEIPKMGIFEDVFLPREGDVSINEIAPLYFSKEHYNIQLSSLTLVRGIDSLFALRLFCEEYQNRSINANDKIITAARGLINLKIERLNEEFFSRLQGEKSATRNPVMDSLEIIANYFYNHHEIEHSQLVGLISPVVKNYLGGSEIDLLLDYFADNAFLIRFQRTDDNGVLKRRKHYYSITYQSLVEHIISERIYHEIKNGTLNRIPQFLHKAMMRPLDFRAKESFDPLEISPNERIIQNIICSSLRETGRLIGENDFLTEGFDEGSIKKYQLIAISQAPFSIAKKFKAKINKLLHSGFTELSFVLEHLILPSSYSSDSFFGAEYLHQILIKLSVFERDKIWSGLDMHEAGKLDEKDNLRYQLETRNVVFRELGLGTPILSSRYLHNERPLIFAWGLSTIDQELRKELRVALTGWAIDSPSEFHLLLEKIFNCNDPQIQEDLASIMLGVASKLKDKGKLKELALWSIENIFKELEINRNILVRLGFRAIVERAFQFGVITLDEVEMCRPRPMKTFSFLPLVRDLNTIGREECYPIVHDLAWYVIKKAYNDFELHKSIEGQRLLSAYKNFYQDESLTMGIWGLPAGIEYIKGLGFRRKRGNSYTQATHGSKSKIFTYEEKYTWLAVHYIQGYLSDYVPVKRGANGGEFVKDYSMLTDIHNPAEALIDIEDAVKKNKSKKEWILKEVLSKEIEAGIEINESISHWVSEEPDFDLENWLSFDSGDFQIKEKNRKWTALCNFTFLYDSKELCCSYFDASACLVKKAELPILREIIERNPDSLHFTIDLDGIHSRPRTDTYSNPIDIVWMTWIEEDETEEVFYDQKSDEEKSLPHTVTEIVQNNVEGESYCMLPSKKIRELIGCYELIGDELKDANGKTQAFNHKIFSRPYRDNQELVLVDQDKLEKALDKEGYEIVWFIQLFKKKNPLNESLDQNFHVQRTRKYFVWTEGNQKMKLKFWDERFSNQRDK